MTDSVLSANGNVSKTTVAALALLVGLESTAREASPDGPVAAEQREAPQRPVAVLRPPRGEPAPLDNFRMHYAEALTNGQYREAETAAKQMIDRMIKSGDRNGSPMASALSSLALAQRLGEKYQAALRNYEAAIEILEIAENRLSVSLIAPLRGLADTLLASGRAELALPFYEHALHLRHVNDGPHSLEQLAMLDAIVTAEIQSGDTGAALETVDRMYYLYARAFAPDSEEVLPALLRKAELLNHIGLHQRERSVYRDIVGIIEDRRGASDLSLFEPYTALAHTYFYDLDDVFYRSEPTTETGETFLRKALAIAEENAEATWLMQAQALVELGDYYTVRDSQGQAGRYYRRAWELMSSDEDYLEQRGRDLEQVAPLIQPALDRYANFGYRSSDEDVDASEYMHGYVVARFTVTDRGRVREIDIVDADPAGFAPMETRVRQALQDFIFRPRYEDGEPVYTHGALYRHEFLYLASDLEAG